MSEATPNSLPSPSAAPAPPPAPLRWITVAFLLLAVLAGPVCNYLESAVLDADALPLAANALSSALAGAALLAFAAARKQPLPNRAQLTALLLLLLPQWCALLLDPSLLSVPWLHSLGSGAVLFLSFAAPLWLALAAALGWVRVEVPRAVSGAAIAGIGAACLVVPVDAFALHWRQAPMLVLQIVLAIVTVLTWTIARDRLAGAAIASAAGAYLLLSALGSALFSVLFERARWQPIDWAALRIPLLLSVVAEACVLCLWFWLLQKMTLAAFGMRALAAWTASILFGLFPYGIRSWRVDLALVIALAALFVALRARTADEQPLALGLDAP